MNKTDRILEKLRKLMNLQQSAEALGNEGEAHAAAAGISRLLLEYNLSLDDIPESEKLDNPVIEEELPFKRSIPGPWFKELALVCSQYNFCKALLVSSFNNRTARYKSESVRIVGRKKNVEVVLYLVSFLENALTVAGRKQYPDYRYKCLFRLGIAPKTEPMFLRSFLAGACFGLREKFEEQRGQVASSADITALVKTTDSEILDFLKGQKIGTARNSKASIDRDIASSGREAGRNVEIHKGIYADSVSENLRLEQK